MSKLKNYNKKDKLGIVKNKKEKGLNAVLPPILKSGILPPIL
jgi:hypothetical protein